ncbi:hypothetical protein V0U79_02750 [Hyphobacterium sp. HN65]|uniref:Uncharacterized protein n=1 Tax=Hyphobacterium lacteum TaxID=3116575 RepID=A0ABU7LPK2_9PROT|nr:hypothetical protein [Hyphobacterium sp. HN65]MEE2525269.1 hypothetical protein [Hyphobacterium sp. HN65]
MIIVLVFAAFIAAAGVSWMVRRAAILDHPNARSSHSTPTPRGGGLGILAAIGIGLTPALVPEFNIDARPVVLAAMGFGLLGLADDLLALGTKLKFLTVVLLGSVITWLAGPVGAIAMTDGLSASLPYWAGFAGSVLWIFVVANSANFMDGSDGLTIANFLPAGLALLVLQPGAVALTGLALAAGLAGFAVFNIPRASLFMGDVGSLAIGAVFAAAALMGIQDGLDVWLYPLLILPVLADVLLTLTGKLRNGIGFLAPHRTHAYQLLVRMGWPHWQVALVYLGLSSVCAVLVILAGPAGWLNAFAAFWGAVIGLTVLHTLVRRRAAASGIDLKN